MTCRRPERHILLPLKWLLIGLALILFSVQHSVAEPGYPVTVTDDRNKRSTIDISPQRIVSLLPSLTETVCALGACDRLVGTDRFSNWPQAVVDLPKLGALGDIQLERLFTLKPDLVLLAESHRVIDRLESLGLQVLALEPRSRSDVLRVTAVLGEVLGLSTAADALVVQIKAASQKAKELIPANQLGARVYFEISAAPYAAGKTSFIGELLGDLGLDNIVSAELGAFPKLNPEFIVRENPDIILGSASTVASMAGRPGWQALDALNTGQSCAFEPHQHDVLVRPGPRLGDAAIILATCIANLPGKIMQPQNEKSADDAKQ